MPDRPPAKPWILSPLSLRRITTSGVYIAEIDGLRFIAILSVVLYHVPIQIALRSASDAVANPFWLVISHGKRGVELFFLISGFILGLPFAAHLLTAQKPVRLRQYFLRRITRLEPPYILSILIRIPLLIVIMHQPLRSVLIHALASSFYLHSLIFGGMSTVNPPAWSLEVEIQFYCLAPIFAFSYFKLHPAWLRRGLGLAFLVAAGYAQVHFFPNQDQSRFTLSILNYVQYFFAGFLLCDLYLTDWKRIPPHWIWDVVSVLAWCWIFWGDGAEVHLLLPIAAFIAYVGAFKGVIFPVFFRMPWTSTVGGMCYSIYLTHALAIKATDTLFHRLFSSPSLSPWLRDLTAYVTALPMVFVFGLLLYLTVERPCMDKNWPSKLLRRVRSGRFREFAPIGNERGGP